LQGYSDLQFHDWRKRCKRLREQLLVLWPDAQDEPGRLIHELGRLADLLGKDHDLAYMQVVLADGLALADLPDEGRRLLRWVAEERTVLQGRAAALGRELYAARPREFARRMRRLLEAGAAGQQ
jgi:CHAD domain-containing protein